MTKEQEFAKRLAERLLVEAKTISDTRHELADKATELYETKGSWIAGEFQEHWPPEIKDAIREYAIRWGQLLERSMKLWCDVAGCRFHTWLKKKESLGIYHY